MGTNAAGFNNILQTWGYKPTTQRQAVLEVILKNQDKHLSAEEVFAETKKTNPRIGLATVYRTLQLFEKVGVLQHISLDDGCMRYEMADPEQKYEHQHLICEVCSDVIEIREDMAFFAEKVFLQKGFRITTHQVKAFGICKKCSDDLECNHGNDGK
ncbi:MAG: transcriptional repressor [Firmicutes bacterium]|nr:transcriptional repressor [Bacillota bacterium]